MHATLMTTTPSPRLHPPDGDRTDEQIVGAIRARLNAGLLGKAEVVELTLACVLARGHLLVEDLPGLGKTTLAKALAAALGGRMTRVQCTPDLLPGDVTGFSVFNQKTREFEFVPGPVFADVLLVDEINRATPRTQSALLEAMAELQVTVDNARHVLAETFFVIATQNPTDHHGTYPLPEAQLDRFAMKLRIGYPKPEDEMELLAADVGHLRTRDARPPSPVVGIDQLHMLQRRVAATEVSERTRRYLVDLATATRRHPQVLLGLSPRGLLMWQRVSQAWAFLQGRKFVTPDDVQHTARPVLEVRLGLDAHAAGHVIDEVIKSVPVAAR